MLSYLKKSYLDFSSLTDPLAIDPLRSGLVCVCTDVYIVTLPPPRLSQNTILSKRLSNVSPFRCYERPCNPYSVNLTNTAPRSRTRRSSNNKTLSRTVSSPNPIFYILTTYWNNFNFGGLCSGRNLKGFNLTLNHKSITQKYNSLNL